MGELADFPAARIDVLLATYQPDMVLASSKFRFWHVESLLNKAADLLDRCLAEQEKLDFLLAQHALLSISIRAAEKSLAVENEKYAANQFDYPATDALRKLESLTDLATSYKNALTEAHVKLGTTDDNNNNVIFWNNNIANERFSMELELSKKEYDRIVDPDLGIVALNKRRLKEENDLLEEKKNLISPGGALDYTGKANRLKDRIKRDYEDAVERLSVAATGLSRIYGYNGHISSTGGVVSFSSVLQSVGMKNSQPIDEMTLWTREAIRWLAAFAQRDQTLTITVSIRKALGVHWNDLLRNGGPEPFSIDESLFSTHRFVRLRGMSASSRQKEGSSLFPIRCIIKTPSKAVVFMKDDNGEDMPVQVIDQKNIPLCTLGFVTEVSVPLEPELCGAISLMNASPIGVTDEDGKLSIELKMITSDDATLLEDIFLTLKVSAQPLIEAP